MLLSDAINYYKVCKLADGYSPETLEVYEWAHIHFLGYVGDMPVGDIRLEQLRTFMLYMREEYTPNRAGGSTAPLSSSSLENLWKALRSFFSWAEEELEIPRPDKRLAKPPNPPPEINPFTQDEIRALIAACDYTKPSDGRRKSFSMRRPSGRRDHAIVLMLLDTGVRAGELARLTVGDVQSEKVYIAPWRSGKKTKSRFVFIGKSCIRSLWRYLLSRHEPSDQDPLFLSRWEEPINSNSLRSLISSLGIRAGVSKAHPHRFRHTFAIQYLRNGGDVFTLQRLLGHSTLEMVQRYLHLADRDAAAAHRSASPVDRWRL